MDLILVELSYSFFQGCFAQLLDLFDGSDFSATLLVDQNVK
jgi:hypothetical protein